MRINSNNKINKKRSKKTGKAEKTETLCVDDDLDAKELHNELDDLAEALDEVF